MKIFTNKIINKIIFLAVLLVLFFNIFMPITSVAKTNLNITIEEDQADGGTVGSQIKKFGKSVGDAVMGILQGIVLGETKINVKTKMAGGDPSGNIWDDLGDNNIEFPIYLVLTPDAIFRNQVGLLNADFIHPIDMKNSIEYQFDSEKGSNYENSLIKLRKTISKWYNGIRNLALVGLLSVLVYIGIRVIISSTAAEKSKYKQMVGRMVKCNVHIIFTTLHNGCNFYNNK